MHALPRRRSPSPSRTPGASTLNRPQRSCSPRRWSPWQFGAGGPPSLGGALCLALPAARRRWGLGCSRSQSRSPRLRIWVRLARSPRGTRSAFRARRGCAGAEPDSACAPWAWWPDQQRICGRPQPRPYHGRGLQTRRRGPGAGVASPRPVAPGLVSPRPGLGRSCSRSVLRGTRRSRGSSSSRRGTNLLARRLARRLGLLAPLPR